MDMEIIKIIELSNLVKSQTDSLKYKREILKTLIEHKDKTYLGLCGPRGAGKTVLLKQLLQNNNNAVYISLDTLPSDFDVFESIKLLNQSYGLSIFLLDEVHFNKEIDKHLKSVFDFLDVKIIFTSSVALKMFRSAQDLSRRVKLIDIYYFSLREYIFLKNKERLQPVDLDQVLNGTLISDYAVCDLHFRKYLEGGVLPFALEVEDWRDALTNILKRVVLEDIPRVHPITLEETEKIFKAIKFIGSSAVEGINPTSLAKNLAITNYKADQYLQLLEQAFIIHRVMPRGTNVLKEPKVLLNIPFRLLYTDYENAIGGLREDFAVGTFMQAGIPITYIKDSRGKKLPDYVLELDKKKLLIEVGGKSKTISQFRLEDAKLERFVLKEGAPYDKKRRPLAALGLLKKHKF